MTPGMIRIQVSRFSDGTTYFCLARTIHKDSGGYHAQQPVQAIGLGCRIDHARELVYSDGTATSHVVTTDASGNYADTFAPPTPGTWNVSALFKGDGERRSTSSPICHVTVEP